VFTEDLPRNSKTKRCNKDKRTITVRNKNKDPLTSFLSPLGRGRKKKKMPSSPLKTGVKGEKLEMSIQKHRQDKGSGTGGQIKKIGLRKRNSDAGFRIS